MAPAFMGPGAGAVEVERAQLLVVMTQRECEHRREALFDGSGGEDREPVVRPEVGYDHGHPVLICHETGAFTQFGLQLLEAHGRIVGGGDVVRLLPRRDQRHAGGTDGEHVDNAHDQMIQDRLDREVGHQRPRELTEDVREPPLDLHETPWQAAEAAARTGRRTRHVKRRAV
jgi:hypothetical protein